MADEVVHLVPPELDGERADKAIAVLLDVSRATARDLIDGGATVDGQRVKPSDRVSAGVEIRSAEPRPEDELEAEPVDFMVLFEDDDVVIVDKPAGVVMHPASSRQRGTLAAGLLHRYPELEGVGDPGRWGLVHRLDKDTSGTVIVARNASAHDLLKQMIKKREVDRIYTALVDGLFTSPTGTIDSPIGRDSDNPRRRAITHDGKPAVTHYQVVASMPEDNCSLVEVKLETGRTHQIRVHFSAIGSPVIGDKTYGSKVTRVSSPRQFLHARRVEFHHPVTGEGVVVESPLPADLSTVLAGLTTR